MKKAPANIQDLDGKVVLITGATEGIGKAAALQFAREGALVTLIGRNREKTEQTVANVRAASGNGRVDHILCDLSRLADVRRAASEFRARFKRLDILVNNAGATFRRPVLGPDGYEMTFALNHLSHFLLTNDLFDLIRKTPGTRVVSTSGSMQSSARFDLQRVASDVTISGPRAYANSKLANILFTKELQRRLGDAVAVNCFHPGIVRTRFGAMGSDHGFLINLVYKLAQPFAKPPEQGADSLLWLATSPTSRRGFDR